MTARATELATEQRVVDRLYARLDELRDRARDRLASVQKEGPSGSPQNRSERDAFATLWSDRAAQLEAVEDRLVFGRLDLDDTASPDGAKVRYVGRIGITDDDQQSLLSDWRAPASEPFYQATAIEPNGVRRRRHLITAGRRVVGVEDELLDLDHADEAGNLTGEGALLASLAQRRTGRMHDIVATIQAEQDKIIRADLSGALVVQGGPGTGKTAVALHRAAYLLYAHRKTLERSGVLLVGPSRAFLRYIDQVLPSLGETGVVATTLGELLPGIVANAHDDGPVAELKGRAIWTQIIRRAVRARERVPEHDIHFRLDGRELVIRRRDVRDAIARARRTGKPHNDARTGFVRDMIGRLVDQYQKKLGRELAPEDRAVVAEDLREMREVRVALNLAWFPISPKRLVDDLFAKPHRLAEAAPEFTEAERALLYREKYAPWTESDVPLLDEAAEVLGSDTSIARLEERAAAAERREALEYARNVIASGATSGAMIPVDAETLADRFAASGPTLTTAERAAGDRRWTYGHVVVDEAQELSAMAWRMLARRVPTRSMTIVGDVAQTSSPAGARSWAQMLDPVLGPSWRQAELTVSYRTPAQVADAAQRVAMAAGLPASPLTAAREEPGAIVLVPAAGAVERDAEIVDQVRVLAGEFVELDGAGRVAVIAPVADVPHLREMISAALPRLFGPEEAARLASQRLEDQQIPVIDPREAKGLEYDAVILVEPAAIARGEGGVSDLYVAMTRPTRRLVVVHAEPLPPGFEPQ